MNPGITEDERGPVPRRRWRPLNEPDRRMSPSGTSAYINAAPEVAFDLIVAESGLNKP
jgi:hypothetical protein